MDTRMTVEERQAFLAETRVGIICISEEGRGPLAVPVWHTYQPGGEVCVWTGPETRKGRLLRKANRISFVVQAPEPPNYKYVSIEGPFSTQPVDLERHTSNHYGIMVLKMASVSLLILATVVGGGRISSYASLPSAGSPLITPNSVHKKIKLEHIKTIHRRARRKN
jgi:hypothetical protein